MSTTYSSSTTTATKDKDTINAKDKDSTETYVRSADATESSKTSGSGGKGKSTTFESSGSGEKTHDVETSYGYGGKGSSGQQHESDQYRRSQLDVQQKLKEVGNLLQKAGHLLQDLQCSSAGEFSQQGGSSQFHSRPSGGNYGGPFGGFESQRGGQYGGQQEYFGGAPSWSSYGQWSSQHPGQFQQSQWGRPSEWSQYESPQRGQQQHYGRGSDEREDRGFSGRGNIFSSRPEDRFSESRQDRGNVDRYGGFGGPNRPDLAYGQQYGLQQQQYGQQSGLGYRSEDSSRRGGDQEFSSYRRGGDRF